MRAYGSNHKAGINKPANVRTCKSSTYEADIYKQIRVRACVLNQAEINTQTKVGGLSLCTGLALRMKMALKEPRDSLFPKDGLMQRMACPL